MQKQDLLKFLLEDRSTMPETEVVVRDLTDSVTNILDLKINAIGMDNKRVIEIITEAEYCSGCTSELKTLIEGTISRLKAVKAGAEVFDDVIEDLAEGIRE